MNVRRFTLSPPPGFDFSRTAFSHGWYALPPFSADTEAGILRRTLQLTENVLVYCELASRGQRVTVTARTDRELSRSQRIEIRRQLQTCLRLEEDFSEFHRDARRHPRFRWIARTGSGRLLRAPTVFEDIVKMMCTTNCTWALTTLMVNNLVEHFGARSVDGRRAFPTPGAIANTSERYLRANIKAGYRSPYILEFAQQVASGALDVESWRTTDVSTGMLFDEIHRIKGIGPYAAGNILKLLGRYDYLGLDSWVRGRFYALHTSGRKVKDSTIEKHYRPYGAWRGLFFWLEMTRDWHEEKFPPV